ncbi:type II toxin-antitoxin system VapC family toxin [Cyanobium sp. BA20m-p-22]|uniref:type II toxin-antitoxin system VapC family toxin n=1 Tax=Cyanobium sp. BA20m-p-22 TaxID=2823704 RepID=UPI0020CB7CDC|nr:type II toxin-antitoxin system VapC family toxin [Cyanobium sp. BA20m-p-22]MCP9910082.1 type II toxin-antitoxin system VapC family toxin [Cyanobium sp. BA20m-p-22]
MKVLLDTHVWLWWLLGSERLKVQERLSLDRLASDGSTHLAAMSLWEAQMLHAKGRLGLDRPFQNWLREAASPGVVQLVPLDVEVVISLHQLPEGFHGDPADRLIVATALAHGLVLATHDQAIRSSGVIEIWTGPRK